MQITFDPTDLTEAALVAKVIRGILDRAGALGEGPRDEVPSPVPGAGPKRARKVHVKDATDSLPIPLTPSPSPARLPGDHLSDEPAKGLFAPETLVAPKFEEPSEKVAVTSKLELVKEKPVDLIDLSTAYAMKVGRAGLVLALKSAGVERVVDLKDGAENTRAFIAAIQSEIGE